jgi:condensin complex subunit 2
MRANQLINDDAAERAARRKSAHFADIGLVDKENRTASPGIRKASALAVQKERRAKRLSAVAPAPQVSMEVMNTNFEEWMKLATDNVRNDQAVACAYLQKITATNTWNFALIDYFHDLTLLRNGPDDQSINFQKASCTLDGCVKIWTSRVDSVATETGKLLSGLAGGAAGDDNDVDGDEDEHGERKEKRKVSSIRAYMT